VIANEPTRYGVRCVACRTYLLPNLERVDLAVMAWNRRDGTPAASGGRATKCVSTAKKRRASRRNLALARAAKKVIKIQADTEDVMAQLKPIRQAEIAQAESVAAESRPAEGPRTQNHGRSTTASALRAIEAPPGSRCYGP
jgi:hypothetical protein